MKRIFSCRYNNDSTFVGRCPYIQPDHQAKTSFIKQCLYSTAGSVLKIGKLKRHQGLSIDPAEGIRQLFNK